MLLIRNEMQDAQFNLALEEHLFTHFQEDFFMLYRNERAVVVGKHQNALAEINYDYVSEHNIQVVRRLSGGGTVFHDAGNVNFVFIASGTSEQVVDFRKYMDPIREALLKLGLEVYYSKRNDLFIDGKKVSGNAEHAVKRRVLHHGTLLFSSQLTSLKGALNVFPDRYVSRAVQSVRSEVTNLSNYLKTELGITAFMNGIEGEVMNHYPGSSVYNLTAADHKAIDLLKREKYSSWDWNFGYSPKYQFNTNFSYHNQQERIVFEVVKGKIMDVVLTGGVFSEEVRHHIQSAIKGARHLRDEIVERLNNCTTFKLTDRSLQQQFIQHLF
jgi:lipoate-protein ligase A